MAIIPFRWARDHEVEPAPLSSLQREMNKLMDTFFTDWELSPTESRMGAFQPHVDVVEREKDFLVRADLPGMDEKDIDISLNKNLLTIKGEKRFEKTENEKNYLKTERTYGSFIRTIPFSVQLDENKIDAQYKKGVLTITLPKAPEAIRQAKKIEIKAS